MSKHGITLSPLLLATRTVSAIQQLRGTATVNRYRWGKWRWMSVERVLRGAAISHGLLRRAICILMYEIGTLGRDCQIFEHRWRKLFLGPLKEQMSFFEKDWFTRGNCFTWLKRISLEWKIRFSISFYEDQRTFYGEGENLCFVVRKLWSNLSAYFISFLFSS